MTWNELFSAHLGCMRSPAAERVLTQFREPVLPTISDARVKEIPIVECGEELIDVRKSGNGRIRMMDDPESPFQSSDCNSGLPSASFMRSRVYDCLEKMVGALDRLASDFGYEAGQVEIRIFEGLRDLKTQKMLFDRKFEEVRAAQAHLSLEEARKETCKWVAPVENNVPVHSTGAAVDLRLWDRKTKSYLDLGILGVIWGANPNAVTFSEGISKIQKANRLYCLLAAAEAGLVNYSYEFWHYSYGDRYAAWAKNFPQADYHSISI